MRIGIIGSRKIGATAATLPIRAGHDVAIGSLPAAAFDGRVVIDANNPYPGRDGEIARLESGETTSSELLAEQLPLDDGLLTAPEAERALDAA